jgi:hypothetical protein
VALHAEGDNTVLTALSSVSEYAVPADADAVRLLLAVALRFREGVLLVEALPEYDECDMRLVAEPVLQHGDAAGLWEVVSGTALWSPFIGEGACLWRWQLTNQSGCRDGAQIHLSAPGGREAEVQWMVEASALRPSVLTPMQDRV